ncbi:hypothetical protein [Salinibius halmophilus]|uniref:hypothetical protein n=1 Tax=Salinibius halmophilus TaxID=1853216 RepID=UPI000E66493C|nr:hypothetical protein [Salinibius halmophilus]
MNSDAIFAKTDQGRAAITDRSIPLSPKQRQLLIMIDGKKRVKDIFPSIDDTAIARVQSLLQEGLIAGDQPATAKPAAKPTSSTGNTLQVTSLPASASLNRIRGILAMCSQQYLSDELDTMLTDVFDHLQDASELQFCLDQWLKRMTDRVPASATNLYIQQVKSLL